MHEDGRAEWPVSCTLAVRHGSCPRLCLTTEPEETQVLCSRHCTRLGSVENKSDPGHALREPSPRAPPSRSPCSRNRHWRFCAECFAVEGQRGAVSATGRGERKSCQDSDAPRWRGQLGTRQCGTGATGVSLGVGHAWIHTGSTCTSCVTAGE